MAVSIGFIAEMNMKKLVSIECKYYIKNKRLFSYNVIST